MKNVLFKWHAWMRALTVEFGSFRINGWFIFSLFFGMISWGLCYELDRVDMNVWDESLFAMRAFHLYDQGSFLQNFNQYAGLYDHPSTKLPFVTLFQSFGFFLFGPSVATLRWVVVLILLGLLVYLSYWCYRYTPYRFLGFFTALILLSSPRFLGEHMARTGDHDALLALFLTLASLEFYRYLQTWESRVIWRATGWFLAALLTKNLLAGMVVPAWLLYAWIDKKLLKLLQQKRVYLAAVLVVFVYTIVLGFYEWRYTGFIQRMWDYELMGRYTQVIEGHSGGFFYYWELLWSEDFRVYVWIWLGLSIYGLYQGATWLKSMAFFTFIITVVSLFILGASSTKLPWYHAVVFPLISIQIAIGLCEILNQLRLTYSNRWRYAITLLVGLTMVAGFIQNAKTVQSKNPISGSFGYVSSVKELKSSGMLKANTVLLEDDFGSDTYFYSRIFLLQANRGERFRMERNLDSLRVGEAILAWKPWLIERAQDRYRLKFLAQFDQMQYLLVEERRDAFSPENIMK